MKTVSKWVLVCAGMVQIATAHTFVHPGGLMTQADIDRIKAAIAAKMEPYYGAWTDFQRSVPGSNKQPSPYALLTDANGSVSVYSLQNNGHDTYALAVYWALTGNDAYAAAAVRMIKGWAATLNANSGTKVATMRTGIGMNQMMNAAELLRHANGGYAGFTPADIAATEAMLKIAVYPILHSAWAGTGYGDANWGTAALSGMMAISIFNSDTAWWNEAVDVYRNGKCQSLNRYILNDGIYTGEIAESGRDQGHPQFGTGNLVQVAEMAWNQGLDLYGESDNLLLKGMEYLASYNLGNTVPYKPFGTCNATYPIIATKGRGSFYPDYEMVWNHYYNRRGIPAPYSQQVRAKYAPEPSFTDCFGHGTLLYYRPYHPVGSGVKAYGPASGGEGLFQSIRVENGFLSIRLQGEPAGRTPDLSVSNLRGEGWFPAPSAGGDGVVYRLNLSDLSRGMYVVRARDSRGIYARPVWINPGRETPVSR